MRRDELIWFDGVIIPASKTGTGVFDHALDYGSTIFDGVRLETVGGKRFFFRLADHVARALRGAQLYHMSVPFSQKDLVQAHIDLAKAMPRYNYFRLRLWVGEPITQNSDGDTYTIGGVHPAKCCIHVAVIGDSWGDYLSPKVQEEGATAIIASYARPWPGVGNVAAKGPSNYAVAQLAKMDAIALGKHDAVMLTPDGFVAEFTGANIIVRNGDLVRTPPLSDCVLRGITRDTALAFSREYHLDIAEERIPQEDLRVADEVMALGTAARVSPIVEINGFPVGNGKPGALFQQVSGWFEDYYRAAAEQYPDGDPRQYLTFID